MPNAITPIPRPEFIKNELLHEFLQMSADTGPQKIAVRCGDHELSYRDLDEQANQLAHYLRAQGVGREDRVAFLLSRSERVYVAMLAILKAGAAYVPLDKEIPMERARFILKDCGAKCLLSEKGLAEALSDTATVMALDAESGTIQKCPTTRIPREETQVTRENLCYMIYTSGTTGQPKGVQIEHRNATNLVRAEADLYQIRPDDRVFQLASPAFDASVEEIWMAFFNRATLVVGTQEIMRSGTDFSAHLTRLGVTVLSCVPTFLSMLEQDIPTVRLLILGGESCPAELALRWRRAGRVIFNTYGPTEATVVSTAAKMNGHPTVTIGKPIANYSVFLLNELGELVPPGGSGEICIGGEGVARGYLNRPALNDEKFITTDKVTGIPVRLYRSADLGRLNSDGDLEYLGRLDDQVKVRGFRIELSEIESALTHFPSVQAAAATVHTATQQIAAFVVLKPVESLDRHALQQKLASSLPSYMVPVFLDILPALPMTLSGKIDRKRLPESLLPLAGERRHTVRPATAAEESVLSIWKTVLKRDEISVEDDFFLHLNGHSLLAAVSVSKLRQVPGFEQISVANLYAHPTAQALARLIKTDQKKASKTSAFHHIPTWQYIACAIGQGFGILLLAAVYAWQWLGAFLTYGYLTVADRPIDQALVGALLVYLATTPAVLGLSIALKWILLGRITAGEYPLWGWYYWRFWFVRAVVRASPVQYLSGTPFMNLYYRLMGARIGHSVFIGGNGLSAFDLFSIGDGSSIGMNTTFDGVTVEGGMLKLATVTVGRNCWIGNRCSLGAHSSLGDGSGLDDLSLLADGTCIPSGELWRGSPAMSFGKLPAEPSRYPWTVGSGVVQLAGIFAFPIITLAAFFPGLMTIIALGHKDPGFTFLMGAPLVALSFVIFLCVEVWGLKWLLLGRIRAGRYPIGSSFYQRLWFFDQLMDLSLEVIGMFYTTLYLRPWLNALGARIGPRSEISTIRLIHPDLLKTGPECFLADDVMVGTPHVRAGWLTLGNAQLGERVFVGNSAVLPSETQLGNNILVGVLSIAPEKSKNPASDGSSWFGSPPIFLPARLQHQGFSDSATYKPPRRMVLLRLTIEFLRIILPSTLFVVLASLIINATDILQDHIEVGAWLAILPILYTAAGLLAIASTLFIKTIFVGSYKEDEKPLWSHFVWRSELVTGVYENLCVLFFGNLLRGTPFISWVLRALGATIGKRCYIDTTWFSEFDLITIGDDVALNEDANIQTHLFEDRVMKLGHVTIKDRCSIGANSTVLYDTQMNEGASLGDLSLLMKGETLSANTRWHGIPAQPVMDTQ